MWQCARTGFDWRSGDPGLMPLKTAHKLRMSCLMNIYNESYPLCTWTCVNKYESHRVCIFAIYITHKNNDREDGWWTSMRTHKGEKHVKHVKHKTRRYNPVCGALHKYRTRRLQWREDEESQMVLKFEIRQACHHCIKEWRSCRHMWVVKKCQKSNAWNT